MAARNLPRPATSPGARHAGDGLRQDATATVEERIAAAQRAELEEEIGGLREEAERLAGEVEELTGAVGF